MESLSTPTQTTKRVRIAFLFSILVLEMIYLTPHIAWATAAYFILCIGLLKRQNRRVHARLMSTAMAMDLAIVLLLELTRNATGTAIALQLGPLQQIHIGASLCAVLFYIPVFALGFYRYHHPAHKPEWGQLHKKLGLVAFVFMTIGFIFMFSLGKES